MSEQLHQRGLTKNGRFVGPFEYYDIGDVTLNDLKRYGIIPDKDYGEYNARKPDGLLIERSGKKVRVVVVLEYKRTKKFQSEKDKKDAVQQCNDLSQVLGATIGVITDTSDFIWINPKQVDEQNIYLDPRGVQRSYSLIKDEQKQTLSRPFIVSSSSKNIDELDQNTKETLLLVKKIEASINKENSSIIQEKTNDPTSLAKQVWQDVWSVSGATPENCLYTFVELFIFKYLSDLGIITKNEGMELSFEYVYGLGEKDAFTYYTKNVRGYLKTLFPPDAETGTTIINGTVLTKGVEGHDKIFYKILNRFMKFGELKNIDPGFKSHLFESFLKESISKKNWGQFFTPRKVVKAIVGMSGIENLPDGSKVCDPFCGVGGFVLEPLLERRKGKNDFYVEANEIKQRIHYFGYDKGFDKEEQKTIILAKANMLIFLSDLISRNKHIIEKFAGIFNETFYLRTKSILGTLDMIPGDPTFTGPYDLILTNPPYVTSGSSNIKDAVRSRGAVDSFYNINAMGVEGLALEWIIRNLKPGGKAFVVIPDGILNRGNDVKLRKFILNECTLDGIISLPLNTFFTTSKKTYILCVTKKEDVSLKQEDPVFTYLVSNIGETLDVYRFNIDSNDLETAKNLFNLFKGAKTHFSTDDLRCKIQPIRSFVDSLDDHWSVDRWWTQEEKIELGLIEEKEEVSADEYLLKLQDLHRQLGKMIVESENLLKKKFKKRLNLREVSLGDEGIFKLGIGERVLKKDLFQQRDNPKAKIPLYSANVHLPFGHIEKSNIISFENPFVLWGIDGDFEFSCKETGEVFATTDHCGTIEILDNRILPEYLVAMLMLKKLEYGFDRGLRASLKNMKTITVDIPINEGCFDLEAQKAFIEDNKKIIDMQRNLLNMKLVINDAQVKIESSYEMKKFKLVNLFDIERGISKYTRKYGNQNSGEYPVYSASNIKPLTFINSFDFEGEYLTWATNGFGGYMKIINQKFSINGDRGILIPKSSRIDINYVKWILEPKLRAHAKGRKGEGGENEFTKVYPEMVKKEEIEMPVDNEGNLDLEHQKEIARQHAYIFKLRSSLSDVIEEAATAVVSLHD